MKMFPIERMVNQTLWYALMPEPYQGDRKFENKTFLVRPYDWGCTDEKGTNEYHFWHKPSGLKIYWYKYPLRGIRSNMEITNVEFYAVLCDCVNSLDSRVQLDTFEKWWRKDKNEEKIS